MATYTVELQRYCPECGQELWDEDGGHMLYVTGRVETSADGSEWVVTLLGVEPPPWDLRDLTKEENRRAGDRLVEMAELAERMAAQNV